MLRTEEPSGDPYYHSRVFDGKQRRFEIQIQGKFTVLPTGTVYIGGEITEGPMELGLVTRGLCNMLLSFARRINSAMNYSFGDKAQEELPHIVFPLWTSVDKMVKTKEGETPPPIGSLFPEDDEVRRKRRSGSGKGDYDTTSTYSFSFNSMYVDLPTWKLVKLPMMRDMDLATFWGTAGLRLVVYESGAKKNKKHFKKDNKYVLCIETRHLDEPEKEELEGADGTEDDGDAPVRQYSRQDSVHSLPWGKVKKRISRVDSYSDLVDMRDNDDDSPNKTEEESASEEEDEDGNNSSDEGFFDAVEKMHSLSVSTSSIDSMHHSSVESEGEDPYASGTPPPVPAGLEPSNSTVVDIRSSLLPIDEHTNYVGFKSAPNAHNLCPGFVDMCDGKIKSKYVRTYAFAVDNMTKTVFRTPAEFNRFFGPEVDDITRTPPKSTSPRLSTAEIQRRIMGSAFKRAVDHSRKSSDLQSFSFLSTVADKGFLRGPRRSAVVATSGANSAGVLLEGAVARALTETHFIEEWAVLTEKHVSFYHPDNSRASFRIPTVEIMGARSLDERYRPSFPGYHFIEIETLGRYYYLMLQNDSLLKRWTEFINNIVMRYKPNSGVILGKPEDRSSYSFRESDGRSSAGSGSQGGGSGGSSGGGVTGGGDWGGVTNDPSESFLHKSSVFKCKKRRLMNCRKLCFRGALFDDNGSIPDPNRLVAEALGSALEPHSDNESDNLKVMLNLTSELKRCNITKLSEQAKLAFFLNLYHLMILHAYLVLGTPTSSFKWISYFNMISYQVNDDIFSLTELEHCIIRAGMNFPAQFLSKYVLPTSRYTFAMNISDPRVNFALNCGSMSNPPSVPIYTVERLEEQLNLASIYYLQENVSVVPKSKGVQVTLPHICQWYANDFGRGRPIDVVKYCVGFLTGDKQSLLTLALEGENIRNKFGEGGIHVKFQGYDFKCRTLTLLDEELLVMLVSM